MASESGRPPHPRLPLLYFSLAHVCLAAAFAALAAWPSRFAAFFYHPQMVAVGAAAGDETARNPSPPSE
jgi:hypothetical protein